MNGHASGVRRPQIIGLLNDRFAEALELSRRFHHLDERALDSPHQGLVVDGLPAERAASFVYRPGFDEAFRFAHQ